ncbi:MAG: hypothetical protein PHI84_06010 [Kiritimatiellae bacterium]|nr:hypothetical protein [Kiritimatiellia bacterium]
MLKNRKTGARVGMTGMLYFLVAVFFNVLSAKAQDPYDVLDTWNDGLTGAWATVQSEAILSNPGNYLNIQFASQLVPMSASEIVRRQIRQAGLDIVITNISFRFKAVDVPASEVRVYFCSYHSKYTWFANITPTNTGEWVSFNMPVNRDIAWVIGPDGCVQQFEVDVGFVDWVGIYVRRHGCNISQNYCIDNFHISGYIMNDSDGDGIPDFWEMAYNVDTNDPDHATCDIDIDGLNLYGEYRAGTDPTNPDSTLALSIGSTNDVAAASGLVVKWSSVGGYSYTMQRSTNLIQGFSVIDSNIPAVPPVNSYDDVSATNSGPYFYKIIVE